VMALSEVDESFVKQAISFKNKLDKSAQSLFRVYAIFTIREKDENARQFLLTNGAQEHESILYISGCNFECAFIGGSICAERSALSVMRRIPGFFELCSVLNLYIVTDSVETPISPGTLCRELMSEFFDESLRIVLACDEYRIPGRLRIATLGELYPFPALFRQCVRTEIVSVASAFYAKAEKLGDLAIKREWDDQTKLQWLELYKRALKATNLDRKDDLHPLRLAAALQFTNGTIRATFQSKIQEYGSTLDPVRKLVTYIEEEQQNNNKPLRLVQVDQFGNLHAPFAAARSYLVENGYGKLNTVVHGGDGKIAQVSIAELVPDTPFLSLL
jgi:cytidine deaminase